jgi:hypothetical protein
MRRLVQAALLARPLILVAAALSWSTAFAEKAPPAASTTLFTLPGPGAPEPQVTVKRTYQVPPNAGIDFNAKVITVVLHGKKVRFTGGRCAWAAPLRAPNEVWSGRLQQKGSPGGSLSIVRYTDTGKISGTILMPTEHGPNWQFDIGERDVTENQFLPSTKKARIAQEAKSGVAAANRVTEEERGKIADAVPLITPGPALPANNPVEQFWKKGNPRFVKLHSIVLNNAAFGADVVTAVIDGKEHRFVGGILRCSGLRCAPPALGVTWKGYELDAIPGCPMQGFITLQKLTNGVIGGYVFLYSPTRRLDIVTPYSSPPSLGSSVQLVEVLEP